MAKPFMCLLMSEAIEAIVKAKRKMIVASLRIVPWRCESLWHLIFSLYVCKFHRDSVTFRDRNGETETKCLRIVYADMKKALTRDS